jgi:hypothetical protein
MKELEEIFNNLDLSEYYELQRQAVAFDDHNIEEEMTKQASNYAQYHALLMIGKRELDKENRELDRISAQLSQEYRKTAAKATAKAVEDYVFCHPEYLAQREVMDDVSFRYGLLKGLVKAIEQRKDMLQQCSANKREETKLYK